MRLVAIDDLELSELGIGVETQPALITADSDSLAFTAKRRETARGTAFFGGSVDEAVWNIVIVAPDRARRDLLYAALLADPNGERRLVAEMDDAAATRAISHAYIRKIVLRSETGLDVDAEAADSRWVAEAVESTSKTFTAAADRRMLVAVPGNHPTKPRIWLIPNGTEKTPNASVGYRWRMRYRVQNDGPVPWFRRPIRITLPDSSTNWGGHAQADGGDVRVVLNGIEQYRTLAGWGTANTYVWVVPPHVPENGGYVDYEIIYGNSGAANGPDLAYPDLPPFTLSTSSNSVWKWPVTNDVANTGKGGWALLANKPPATPDYTVPGSWRPARTINNPNNTDLVFQGPYYDQGGSTRAMAIFRARRTHESNEIAFGEWNEYDGVALYSELPVTHILVNFQANLTGSSANPRVVILNRTTSADLWAKAYSAVVSSGGGATIAPGPQTLDVPSRHIACAVWPNDSWAWQDAYPTDLAEVWWKDTLEVTFDTSDLSITQIEPETEIYEFATDIRLGGGPANADDAAVPPYMALRVGNANRGEGAGTPRVTIPLDDHAVTVDCETYEHLVWEKNADDVYEVVERVSAHAVRGVTGYRTAAGVDGEADTSDWLPLRPTRAVVPNGGFDANISGIETDNAGGASIALAHDATKGGQALGSLKLSLTAGIGAGAVPATAKLLHSALFPVAGRRKLELGAWLRTTSANLRPYLTALFYDASGLAGFMASGVDPNDDWTPVANTDYGMSFAVRVPEGAHWFRVGLWMDILAASFTGDVWFDDLTIDGSELTIRDDAVSSLTVRVDLAGAWVT